MRARTRRERVCLRLIAARRNAAPRARGARRPRAFPSHPHINGDLYKWHTIW